MAKTQKKTEGTAHGREYAPFQYDVKIHTLYPEGSCRALASVNLNGNFAIRGIKVMEGSNGLFISMPSYRAGNGEYKDICFPCTREARNQMNEAVLDAYQQALSQGQVQVNAEQSQDAPQMAM